MPAFLDFQAAVARGLRVELLYVTEEVTELCRRDGARRFRGADAGGDIFGIWSQ